MAILNAHEVYGVPAIRDDAQSAIPAAKYAASL